MLRLDGEHILRHKLGSSRLCPMDTDDWWCLRDVAIATSAIDDGHNLCFCVFGNAPLLGLFRCFHWSKPFANRSPAKTISFRFRGHFLHGLWIVCLQCCCVLLATTSCNSNTLCFITLRSLCTQVVIAMPRQTFKQWALTQIRELVMIGMVANHYLEGKEGLEVVGPRERQLILLYLLIKEHHCGTRFNGLAAGQITTNRVCRQSSKCSRSRNDTGIRRRRLRKATRRSV